MEGRERESGRGRGRERNAPLDGLILRMHSSSFIHCSIVPARHSLSQIPLPTPPPLPPLTLLPWMPLVLRGTAVAPLIALSRHGLEWFLTTAPMPASYPYLSLPLSLSPSPSLSLSLALYLSLSCHFTFYAALPQFFSLRSLDIQLC